MSKSRISEEIVLYIFHRDLRIHDNKTLIEAVAFAREHKALLLPVFIFVPQQINGPPSSPGPRSQTRSRSRSSHNPYKSNNSVQFMIASLEELDEDIREDGGSLLFLYGDTAAVVEQIAERLPIKAIFETLDYTPFAKKRTESLKALKIPYHGVHDTYLTDPGSVLTGTGRTFQKFTPFYNAARRKDVSDPLQKPKAIPWFKGRNPLTPVPLRRFKPSPPNKEIHVGGGRREGLALLKAVPDIQYTEVHDVPSKPTTNLSAHNHFGTIGIREFYAAARHKNELIRQLYWRDFYGHICAAFEDLYGISPYKFQAEGEVGYAGWSKDRTVFNAWCRGETGVPIVDAAMQQLLKTGYMHNRSRLIVSNWLVKDKKIYWRWGERFFAKHLVDYDFAQNFGNWCWVASVLPFSQAPFRRLDAETQAKKFDKDGAYVKRWLSNRKENE
jgi:deoxyribodipyrimidine photo-lyase